MTDRITDPKLRGLFMGSGSGLAEPGMAERVIELSGEAAAGLEVLYLGTATYDLPEPRQRQAVRFAELGCEVGALDVATHTPAGGLMEDALARADVLLVSGGNTLYAVDRWVELGLDVLITEAIAHGAVVCGGSAGAICWFDGGHSDSMDPTSFLDPIPEDDPRAGDWRYIRVDGLGILPGLLCPHYDVTGSNGVQRAADFASMMLRHPGETGLGLDNWAGLLVEGGRYEVVRPEGREGSVRNGRFVDDGSGRPGLWLAEVADGAVTTTAAPVSGAVGEILRRARVIDADPLVEACRTQNPARVRA